MSGTQSDGIHDADCIANSVPTRFNSNYYNMHVPRLGSEERRDTGVAQRLDRHNDSEILLRASFVHLAHLVQWVHRRPYGRNAVVHLEVVSTTLRHYCPHPLQGKSKVEMIG